MKKSKSSDGKIDSRRISRVEQEIQSIVSLYIIQNLQAELPGLVTIGRVRVPGDLRTANIYVSLLNIRTVEDDSNGKKVPSGKELEKALKTLQAWSKDMQDAINKKLQMKYLPKLTFFADESTEKILRIEKILSHMSTTEKVSGIADDEN
ncbi:MAG: 30S ribosome-binding factor RbfA [Moraxellaceae bacterium]|nr:30S ribosome-binding factor RbfA [Pseudobdellovibrionaceae bacterium]